MNMTLKLGMFCTFSFILKQNPNLNGIFLSTSGIHHEWDTYLLFLARFSTICKWMRRVRNNLVALLCKTGPRTRTKHKEEGEYVSVEDGERNAGICHIL